MGGGGGVRGVRGVRTNPLKFLKSIFLRGLKDKNNLHKTIKRLSPVDYTDDYLSCQDYRRKPQQFGTIMRSSNLLDWLIDVRLAFHPCRGARGDQN